MKFQPNRDYNSNDAIMTPKKLAYDLVNHFRPQGVVLEPCRGTGNFFIPLQRYAKEVKWCEITEGKDFFEFQEHVDWIFTNPPWSQIKAFLTHSVELADNIAFLFTINHLFTKARINLFKDEFWIREIILFETPKEFPQSGFQVGMVHLMRGYSGGTNISFLENTKKEW